MTIREVLQIEIWSETTSRKILKALGFIGIGLVIVACVGGLWIFVEGHWLTAGERLAAKTVLPQIESLRSFDAMNDVEFDDRVKRAQIGVDAAEQKIRTSRDRQVCAVLSAYLELIKMRRSDQKVWEHIESRQSIRESDEGKKSRLKADEMNRTLQNIFSESLHKVLDK